MKAQDQNKQAHTITTDQAAALAVAYGDVVKIRIGDSLTPSEHIAFRGCCDRLRTMQRTTGITLLDSEKMDHFLAVMDPANA